MHKLIKAFILTFGHIDDVLWLNNPNFADMIPLIYPKETKKQLPRPQSSTFYQLL
jgi:hypothetical protein